MSLSEQGEFDCDLDPDVRQHLKGSSALFECLEVQFCYYRKGSLVCSQMRGSVVIVASSEFA